MANSKDLTISGSTEVVNMFDRCHYNMVVKIRYILSASGEANATILKCLSSLGVGRTLPPPLGLIAATSVRLMMLRNENSLEYHPP